MTMQVTFTDESGQPVATFTPGCRTALVYGPPRTFSERKPDGSGDWPTVTHGARVRVLPVPFSLDGDAWVPQLPAWIAEQVASTSPDALDAAMDHRLGGPLAAQYSLLGPDGKRTEGADWYDYFGARWISAMDGEELQWPELARRGCLDCSGLVRMVYGHRMGLPLSWDPATLPDGQVTIPRRSHEIYTYGPGVQLTPDADFLPGDLLSWDAQADDGERIDHNGIYLGVDAEGHRRFISSRKTPNGPTMGDTQAKSHLDGTGIYTTSFVGGRRL